jgi:hypothetical protein
MTEAVRCRFHVANNGFCNYFSSIFEPFLETYTFSRKVEPYFPATFWFLSHVLCCHMKQNLSLNHQENYPRNPRAADYQGFPGIERTS